MSNNSDQSREDGLKTFILLYRLIPEKECRNLHHQSTEYRSNNFNADFSYAIWQDMLTVYYQCGKADGDFQLASRRADLLVRMFLSGYAFYALRSINHILTNWLEFDGKLANKIVVGKIEETHPDPDHADNKPLRESETILPIVSGHASLRRALIDFHSSIREVSPDLYVFAYRSIEDIRSHFENSNAKDSRRLAWEKMNENLGYSKEDYDGLVKLSERYRHSNALEEPVDPSVAQRQIGFVRGVILKFIQYLRRQQ